MRTQVRALALVVPPCLAAMFPLALLVRSHITTHLFSAPVILRPASVLVAAALLVLLMFRFALGSARKASLAATVFFVVMGLFPLLFPVQGAHSLLAAVLFTAAALGVAAVTARILDGFPGLVLGWTVALVAAWTIIATLIVSTAAWPPPVWRGAVDRIAEGARSVRLPEGGPRPDIYYIVLDGMARADALERLYGLDAAPALTELEALGVLVPRRSRSNYSMTQLSLASALNMQYLSDLATVAGDGNDRRPLHRLSAAGGVPALLKRHGYEFVVVGSAALIAFDHAEADRTLGSLPDGPTELEHALLSRTPVRGRHIDRASLAAHGRKVLESFSLIESVRSGRPLFVMAHILTPHPPFVLGADGSQRFGQEVFSFSDGDGFPGTREEYTAGYRAQAAFVLQRVVALVKRIAAVSPDAVIVVHGDHGPGLALVNDDPSRTDAWERLAIFSAYYPGGRDAAVEEDMSPVNALRWALRTGLGADVPLLPNRSYLSGYTQPYRWREIPASSPESRGE